KHVCARVTPTGQPIAVAHPPGRLCLVPEPATGLPHAWANIRERVTRTRTELHEIGKFGIIGMIAWVVDTGVFNPMLSLQGNRYWAAVVSTTVSATVAFIGNRFWTWRDRPRSGLRREYVLYAFFNVVGLFISLACLGLSHEVLGSMWPQVFHTRLADNVAKQGVGLLLGTIFRLWSSRPFHLPECSGRAAHGGGQGVGSRPVPGPSAEHRSDATRARCPAVEPARCDATGTPGPRRIAGHRSCAGRLRRLTKQLPRY